MTLVAGVDSSTQSCKVVIRDADSGRLVRSGTAPHPPGTEVDPGQWLIALRTAIDQAGGLADVAAVSIAGQQHGLVALDRSGRVIRPALLWNDVRSAAAAADLTVELGDGDAHAGARRWSAAVGLVPTASFTVAKIRWLAQHEPDSARRMAAVALPHDWLTWRLAGARDLNTLVTDRSDASGTGYFDAVANHYRRDLLALALRGRGDQTETLVLPRVLAPQEVAGRAEPESRAGRAVLGAGLGDNAAAALGLQLVTGETMLSLGTSGVVGTVADRRADDPTGLVAGFADATGRFLHLAVTLNAAQILDATARVLGVDHGTLSDLALAAPAGAEGLIYVPYLEGERTPNRPEATGTLYGMSQRAMTPEAVARATVEGLLCHMAYAIDVVRAQGTVISSVTLIGGAARAKAVRELAPAILGVQVRVPPPGEYVADGAARQAAWTLSGHTEPPNWPRPGVTVFEADPTPDVYQAFRHAAQVSDS